MDDQVHSQTLSLHLITNMQWRVTWTHFIVFKMFIDLKLWLYVMRMFLVNKYYDYKVVINYKRKCS
ncbi:hypothetical protein Lalb_Chr09g0328531 [Lupinus albus]|uniref:Uncharacterized protein n=1 Tax=Lupinus albus TaxID=3870 RepID=A0A6A4PZS4_LUPAL|nr:hypothetical protein Lalb_Chr09g0328531 [Lupinus albus]